MERSISKRFMKKATLILMACFFIVTSFAQQKSITGTVYDEEGIALPGVSVLEKGTTNGTITNIDGVFNLDVTSGNATLVLTFIGMEQTEVALNGQSNVNVTMKSDIYAVDEVVVTALGISRDKKALGYSVTEVQAEDISVVKDHNPINSLAGKVAGVVISQGTGSPGAGARVIIRGNNSLNANNQPLIVVDGVPLDATGTNSGASVYNTTVGGGGITDINADDIESMSVLKGLMLLLFTVHVRQTV